MGLQAQGAVAQQLVVGRSGNGQLHPAAGHGRHRRRGRPGNEGCGLRFETEIEALEVGHGRTRPAVYKKLTRSC